MFEKILSLQVGSFFGGGIGSLLYDWEQMGLFSYVLPFLLIFALVFGILTKVKVFDNKSVNAIISLVVGLLALQFNVVSTFFSEIFPKLGIGLAVLLVFMILVGLFLDPKNKYQNYSLLGVAVIIFIVVLVQTFGWFDSSNSWMLYQNLPQIIGVIIFLVILGVIVISGDSNKRRKGFTLPGHNPIIFQGG
ncbi:hypothetical protein K0A97_02485 [Patescibacteria group bacterium]|nr:hypothetical protein [Patescibacteria group bacterium]